MAENVIRIAIGPTGAELPDTWWAMADLHVARQTAVYLAERMVSGYDIQVGRVGDDGTWATIPTGGEVDEAITKQFIKQAFEGG